MLTKDIVSQSKIQKEKMKNKLESIKRVKNNKLRKIYTTKVN